MSITDHCETIGRTHEGLADRIDGYRVITIDGVRVGSVAGMSSDELLVRTTNWLRRSLLALPVERAVIRDIDRTVLMLISPTELSRVPGAAPNGVRSPHRWRRRLP